jgi:Ca2+-binding RTX toxin-like protein
MARLEIGMADRQSVEGSVEGMMLRLAQADGSGASGATGAAPATGPDCAVTAEGSPITIPVLANDGAPGGEPLTLLSTSEATSGDVTVNADGTVTFRADEPGLQSFRYQAGDGRGGSSSGSVDVLVNSAEGTLTEPVLSGLGNAEISRIARACADATALGVTTLRGPEVIVPSPEAGERIVVATEPGQRIALDNPAFVRATYLVVDEGLLVLSQDGRVVFLSDFVDSAGSGDPVTLAVAGRPPVSGEALLAGLQPLTAPAAGEPVIGRVDYPEAGPEHGGGANFAPYDPGALPPGLLPLGPLGPTSLAFGSEFLIQGTGDETLANGGLTAPPPPLGNEPPTISGTADIERQAGTLSVTPEFASAGPLPTLTEGTAVDPGRINGVDPANLRIGPRGDATIVFNDEVATFQDTLGVYLIGENGEILDPKIVFPQVEHADALPNGGTKRPGGGPLNAGDEVALSELYDASQLQPGTQFGLFVIANGFRLNGGDFDGDLRFLSGADAATIFDAAPELVLARDDGSTSVLRGNVFHTADPTPDTPLDNPLNDGGNGQVLSGLLPDRSGLTIGFEDKLLGSEDNDFNDVLIDVELTPSLQIAFAGGDVEVFTNAVVNDQDDPNLSGAVVELIGGGLPGDALLLGAPLTDVSLAGADPDRIELAGTASLETYTQLLRSITLDAAPVQGDRQVGLTLTDARGATSETFVINVDLSDSNSLIGGAGDDPLDGQPLVDDAIVGDEGADRLFGDSGSDLLAGGPGNDVLIGGEGDDILSGGPGVDQLNGGAGADQHLYQSLADRGDVIRSFDATAGDTLDFSSLFGGGADAGNVDDFVSFTPSGGDVRVSVDADGGGASFSSIPYLTLVDPTGVTTPEDAVNNGTVVV